MSNSTLSVGGHVESRCTKCRTITNHIVVAMDGGIPVKVQCNTCGGEHKYRPPAAPKKATTKRAATTKVTGQKEWHNMSAKLEEAQAADYSMDSSFKINTVIKHPIFGLGLVEKIAGPRKMEVLFEQGRKLLRCK